MLNALHRCSRRLRRLLSSNSTRSSMASCSLQGGGGVCGSRPAYTEEQKQKLKARLSPEAYAITQEGDTERPFTGKYNKHYEKGLYKCIVCETPLFPSTTKFDSGTGWPSFWQPIEKDSVAELVDRKHGMVRTEVQCKSCSAHLGHVFNDGPRDKTGIRYCINSASLEFQPE